MGIRGSPAITTCSSFLMAPDPATGVNRSVWVVTANMAQGGGGVKRGLIRAVCCPIGKSSCRYVWHLPWENTITVIHIISICELIALFFFFFFFVAYSNSLCNHRSGHLSLRATHQPNAVRLSKRCI